MNANTNTNTNTPVTTSGGVIPVTGTRRSPRAVPGSGPRRQLLPNGVYQTVSAPNALSACGIRTAGFVIALESQTVAECGKQKQKKNKEKVSGE